jgi:hypothetical protein
LAEAPGWKLAGAITLSNPIALAKVIALSDTVSYITWPEATGASLTDIAVSDIALAKTLLNLSSCRALADIRSRALALEPVCYVRIVVAKTAAKAGIVYPSVSVAYAGAVEIISVDEVVVDLDIVISPSSVPTPVVPASAPDCAKGESGSPGYEAKSRWVVHGGIGISGRSPYRFGIVLRDVDDFRSGRLDSDVILTVASLGRDRLLGCRFEDALLLSFLAQALDRLHDTVLLRQDSIPEIRCPLDVLAQALQNVGHHYQRLDACVPRLFRSRVGQCLAGQCRVLPKPSLCLHDLKRVGGCDEHLAEDWVGI